MASQRIVCTDQVPVGAAPQCARIVSVGVSKGGDVAEYRLTVEEVVRQLSIGEVFYTVGLESGKVALVESYWCSRCRRYHIRSKADCVYDNNLDYLRYCSWQKAA